jgi:hypothetical protein
MKSKQKHNAQKAHKNPLYRGVPKPLRPKTSFDGQYLNIKRTFPAVTVADTVALVTTTYPINTTVGSMMGQYGSAIANTYSEYVYEKAKMHWLSNIGPAGADAGGRIYVSYYDNPEQLLAVAAATAANQVAYQKGTRNTKVWNLWESFEYHVPLTRRRKSFDINTTNDNSVDVTDRSTQGMIAVSIELPTSAGARTIGYPEFTTLTKLMGFNIVPS